MKINAENYNGKDVRVIFGNETRAEAYQLEALKKALTDAGADWFECGRYEIGVVVRLKPMTKVRVTVEHGALPEGSVLVDAVLCDGVYTGVWTSHQGSYRVSIPASHCVEIGGL